ncbi:MAG: hypothetical protein KJ548_02055, partial [Actinobacteria bacterium]|nr:hypothetical protein [Actinomycetota bacterium]
GSEVSGLGGLADPPKEEGGTSNYQEPPQDNSISPKVTSPARTGEDDDDEYPRARDLLLALPEAQQDRARAWALAEFPDATATRRAIEAARMLGVLA